MDQAPKKGRPKKKANKLSLDEDEESYEYKEKKKDQKLKQKIEEPEIIEQIQKEQPQKDPSQSSPKENKQNINFPRLTKKKKTDQIEQPQEFIQINDQEPRQEIIWIVRDSLNINKTFLSIINKTQNPEFMKMLSNIFTQCKKKQEEKKNNFKRRWSSLSNSNITQFEYAKREKELKKQEQEEFQEISENTIGQLYQNQVEGFESKEKVIEDYRIKYLQKNTDLEKKFENNEIRFQMKEEDANQMANDQLLLLEKLMREQLIQNQIKFAERNYQYQNQDSFNKDNRKISFEGMEEKDEDDGEMDQHEQRDQFKKIELGSYFRETSEIENDSLREKDSLIDKVFSQKFDDICILPQEDTLIMDKHINSFIADYKSDDLFLDPEFSLDQHNIYVEKLKKIYEENEFDLKKASEQTFLDLIEISAYILNVLHYNFKHGIDNPFIHPMDMFFILDKYKQTQKKREREKDKDKPKDKDKDKDKDKKKQKQKEKEMEQESETVSPSQNLNESLNRHNTKDQDQNSSFQNIQGFSQEKEQQLNSSFQRNSQNNDNKFFSQQQQKEIIEMELEEEEETDFNKLIPNDFDQLIIKENQRENDQQNNQKIQNKDLLTKNDQLSSNNNELQINTQKNQNQIEQEAKQIKNEF